MEIAGKKHDGEWFGRRVSELRKAIRQLPDERLLELFFMGLDSDAQEEPPVRQYPERI